MDSFREWLEQEDFIEYVQHVFNEDGIVSNMPQPTLGKASSKPWSAKKKEIINLWQQMLPDMPIIMEPMSKDAKGGSSSYGQDGLRITGSWQFIASILSRLKALLTHENQGTKLRLILKAVDSNRNARPDRRSYVFYLNLQPRSKGKPGRKHKLGS